jgi:hypothetical protein
MSETQALWFTLGLFALAFIMAALAAASIFLSLMIAPPACCS